MKTKPLTFLLALTFLFLFSGSPIVFGDDNKDSFPLLKAKSLKCSFPDGIFTKWDTNAFHTKTDKTMTDIVFDSINLEESRARILGKSGTTDATALASVGALIFVETTRSGTMNITSIFIDLSKGEGTGLKNTFLAVHSRHVSPVIGSPLLFQYYGKCKIWDLEQQ
jgi:hypothetical protein